MTDLEKQLLETLSMQVEGVVNTLMKLRKPETAYETMRLLYRDWETHLNEIGRAHV